MSEVADVGSGAWVEGGGVGLIAAAMQSRSARGMQENR